MTTEWIIAFVIGATAAGAVVYYIMKLKLVQAFADRDLAIEQQTKTEALQQQMNQQFEILAMRVIDERGQKLNDQSTKNLSMLLEPFKERLKDFEKKVEDIYAHERSERGSLRGELNKLLDLNLKMSSETQNLTKALKGDVKVQGSWGELILETILERSGLRRDEEYIIQASDMSLKNEMGQSIRPDVIVKLPDDKHIIIDSKVSLQSFERYAQATETSEQNVHSKAHVESLRRHVEGLAAKKYHTTSQLTSPDFVLLFMPLEPAFALAFRERPELFQEAFDKGIAIVSPTTLHATLRTVASIWKYERQERNALEIAKRGGALYDKFVGLMSDFENIGKKLEDANKSHQQMLKKMSEGQGNLLWQVDQLRELGVKTEKRLSQTDGNAQLTNPLDR